MGPIPPGDGFDRPADRAAFLWSGGAVAVRPRRSRTRALWVWTILAATIASLFLATGGRFLSPDVPLLGDLGGHVHALTELRELLEDGRIRGWSHDWFSGFPLFFFYFPLPALLALGLAELIGLAPGVAAVVVLGPALLPIATGVLVRSLGGSRGMAAAAGVAAAVFLLSRSLAIAGGTLESAMIGEFSYSVAMALAVFYLASIPRGLDRRAASALVLPTLLLAATALSHVLVTAMAVVLSAAIVDDRRRIPRLIATWVLAFLLAGWWTVPFLLLGGEMHHFTWPPLWEQPSALAYVIEGVPLLALLVLGLSSLALRSHPRLLRLCAVAFVVGVVPPFLGELRIHGARLLPFAFWAAHVAGAIALYSLARYRGGRRWRLRTAAAVMAVLVVGAVAFTRQLPRVATEMAFRGTEGGEDAGAWRAALAALAPLPPGPVLVVPRATPDPAAPSLLDAPAAHAVHVTGRPTLAGLYAESAPIFEYVRIARWNLGASSWGGAERAPDPSLGLIQARLLGVRYLLITFPEEAPPIEVGSQARPLDRHERWILLELDGAGAIEPVDRLIPVDRDELRRASRAWIEDGGRGPVPVEAPGPLPALPEHRSSATPGDRPRLTLGRDSMMLTGLTPGRPYLLRRSYFPNWTLSDRGMRVGGVQNAQRGEGPYRAGLNQMLIVPADTVAVLRWQTGWPERAGYAATAIGLASLIALFALGDRSRTPVPAGRGVTRWGRVCSAAGHVEASATGPDAPFSA